MHVKIFHKFLNLRSSPHIPHSMIGFFCYYYYYYYYLHFHASHNTYTVLYTPPFHHQKWKRKGRLKLQYIKIYLELGSCCCS